MKKLTIADLENKVGIELEGQIPGLLLQTYQQAVQNLIIYIDDVMNLYPNITWDDVEAVADIQLQVCEFVHQMIK